MTLNQLPETATRLSISSPKGSQLCRSSLCQCVKAIWANSVLAKWLHIPNSHLFSCIHSTSSWLLLLGPTADPTKGVQRPPDPTNTAVPPPMFLRSTYSSIGGLRTNWHIALDLLRCKKQQAPNVERARVRRLEVGDVVGSRSPPCEFRAANAWS